jgi:type IV secretion system protein VirB11
MKPLEAILTDRLVEIAINPDGNIWIEERGDSGMRRSTVKLDADAIRNIANQIANTAKVVVSEKKPVFSVSVNFDRWLMRAQVLMPPAVQSGVAISLRFFNPDLQIFEPKFLYGNPISSSAKRQERNLRMKALAGSADLRGALELCVAEKMNLVVSGGTSSGKTMLARYLQKMIGDEERIITIEDAPDLLPAQPNKVQMVSLEDDPYRSPDKLMQACLRMRPDRIILSEIRGRDAYTFLKAINTGHGGSITTLHADTAQLAVSRLAQAALEAAPAMSFTEMKAYISQSIDVIIQTKKDNGKRGVVEIFLPGEVSE